jgi:HD superfamily phosphodiesterase
MSSNAIKMEDIPEIHDPLDRAILEKAQPFLRIRHNDIHTVMSYWYAMELLTEEGGDRSVVAPAILLHDVGWSAVPEEKLLLAFGPVIKEPDLQRLHEVEGAKLAGSILRGLKYPEDLIGKIELIISGHDTRLEPIDIDDMIVKDADKLFRFSRTGFPIHAEMFELQHSRYLAYLSKVAEQWFFTDTAFRLAREEVAKREEDLAANLFETVRQAPSETHGN